MLLKNQGGSHNQEASLGTQHAAGQERATGKVPSIKPAPAAGYWWSASASSSYSSEGKAF